MTSFEAHQWAAVMCHAIAIVQWLRGKKADAGLWIGFACLSALWALVSKP
jgi:hypothetical protein